MTGEPMQPLLEAWFRDREAAPADVKSGVARVMAHVPQTRQQGRWWPLPTPGRKTAPATDIPRTEFEPSPIPATYGRAPMVKGRTRTMFSPVKAITAGVLVFAIGGAFLIAQPFGQRGSAPPGADADTDTGNAAATLVTGDIHAPGSDCSWPTFEQDGAVRHEWGYHCEPQTWTTSDPRLSGDVAALWNADVHQTGNGFTSVITAAYFVTNEAGGWTCRSEAIAEGYGLSYEYVTGETATCVGDGDYEGLSATLALDYVVEESLIGLIFPGDAPPVPQPPAAE